MKKKATLFTPEAFHGFELLIDTTLQKRLVPFMAEIKEDIHRHQMVVDGYIKQTVGWHEEQHILAARVDRVRDVLIKKDLASPEELAV